jgi:preprotein translocase SecE subunit
MTSKIKASGKIIAFFKEVRAEVGRITWADRRETMQAVVTVVIAAFIAGLFFMLVDTVAYKLIYFLLKVGN